MSSFHWELGTIVGMVWNSKENLVIVGEDGTTGVFSIHGERVMTFAALPGVSLDTQRERERERE